MQHNMYITFADCAWVAASFGDRAALAQAVAAGCRLMFFHGIFVAPRTRMVNGLPRQAFPATLRGFHRHDRHGPSDLSEDATGITHGVVGWAENSRQLYRLDKIEHAPYWYRREQAPIFAASPNPQGSKLRIGMCEFYIMNKQARPAVVDPTAEWDALETNIVM